MIEIALNNIKKIYGGDTILHSVNCEVQTGERLGLIGRNGTGKTTIFKIISGIEDYDDGNIFKKKGVTIGYLDQVPVYENSVLVENVINEAFERVIELGQELKKLEQTLSKCNSNEYDQVMQQYSIVQEQFEALNGYEMNVMKDKVCTGFKISDKMRKQQFNSLSGGEKSRVLIARMLLFKPDVLLLDEPTNHLDIGSIEWLESFLKEYSGAVIIVSHDRYFLDRVVTRIIELEHGLINDYAGNYSYYVKEKELKEMQEFEAFKDRKKKIKAMKAAALRFRTWGKINTDNAAHMARAKRLEKKIEELEAMGRPQTANKIHLNVKHSKRSGNIVVNAEKLSKAYGHKKLFHKADFLLNYCDRAALLGDNGTGKTTLFKMMLGLENQDFGEIGLGSSVQVGYLEQEVSFENEDISIIDLFRKHFPMLEGDARNKLARFLFVKLDVYKKVCDLSGGEKVRLKLCMMMEQEINFLLMDEPTNHLDIDSREMLELALEEFKGTILFISHDRYFINKTAEKIYAIENLKVKEYPGNYDYYRSQLDKKIKQETSIKLKKTKNKSWKNDSDKASKKREKKLKEIQESIEMIESQISHNEEKISLFGSDLDRLTKLFKEKEELKSKLDSLYGKWEEFEENHSQCHRDRTE